VDGIRRTRATRKSRHSLIEEQTTLHEEWELGKSNSLSGETEARMRVQDLSVESAYRSKGKSLALLQINRRSIYNKAIEFQNLVDTYNPHVIIGMESWLKEDISSADVFIADFTTFRRDKSAHDGGVFIYVKNAIVCTELWVDEDVEMITVKVKGMDPNYSFEIIGINRAPNEDMLAMERLVARTKLTRDVAK
jgi:hypothetical protein